MAMPKPVKHGKITRMSFSKINEVLEMPNLIEVQKKSYQWFLDEGIMEVLKDASPIVDHTGAVEISFTGYSIGDTPKYPVEECKDRDVNYAAPLQVTVRLYNRTTGEVTEKEINMGDFPLMTDNGTFVINGAERVVVSQIVRSPGMYFDSSMDKTGKKIYTSAIIPYRGAWIECSTDAADIIWVNIDKNRKMPITIFIRALGIESDKEILAMFGDDKKLVATLAKDIIPTEAEKNNSKIYEEALKDIYKRLRPGEPATLESAEQQINRLFFDSKTYNLDYVGRYKFDKKLAIGKRILGLKLAAPVASMLTGEILYDEGTVVTAEIAKNIEDECVNEVLVYDGDDANETVKIFSNGAVNPEKVLGFDLKDCGIREKCKLSVLNKIIEEVDGEGLDGEDRVKKIKELCRAREDELSPKHITKDDILSSINYLLNLTHNIGEFDDIDHLGNRRLRCVGELLQNSLRIGFSRMDKNIRERMQTQDIETITPDSLINVRPVYAVLKEFFGSSPLSQFMDQNNPLAELTHKRRISALGPGGLSRDRASFEVRDVHYTHYGRICPIETPEGSNIGLISYLSTYAKINKYGFIEAPYRKIDKATGIVTDEIEYMSADVEDNYYVAQANEPLDAENRFVNKKVSGRYRSNILAFDASRADYMDISPKMVVSVATACIPFLESDDNSRALMGANMQKQAVPLLVSEAPIVATGMEYKAAVDSGVVVCAKEGGIAERVTADEIIIRTAEGRKDVYTLLKFKRSNQGTCINQRPIINQGDVVEKGEVIADGPATSNGEISLGKNALIGFMSWEGYNYEDAVLLNERLVRDDVYTSVHIEEYSIEARETKLGPEEITREVPQVGDDALKDLDADGIIRKGSEVRAGDILVGKVTPKGETELSPQERLVRAIFAEKAREVRDTSLKLPHGESGIVVDIKEFSRDNGDELPAGVLKSVRVYVAQKRKISVGDKMAGRHGNKGVVSRILPPEDMPYLPDGTPLDIVLNPMGVPSRMNIGQLFEVHLGIAAKKLGWRVLTPVFDGAKEKDIHECLEMAGLRSDGKMMLRDGRTGEYFDNPVTVGIMYYLKLHHLVDDKIHARSTGPYSLVTQQPLGGKAQFGGQRFGEMEVWALEAYGAAYTLQEILTVKSDDVNGRLKTYEAIVKGENIPTPNIPEAFKVLVKELRSLALDVKVLDDEGNEVDLSKIGEDDAPFGDKHGEKITHDYIGQLVETNDIGDSSFVGDVDEMKTHDNELNREIGGVDSDYSDDDDFFNDDDSDEDIGEDLDDNFDDEE